MSGLLLGLLLAGGPVSGVVYDDANGNGRRDPAEAGLSGVVVTDGVGVAATAADGSYRIESASGRYVFVVTPGDRRSVGSWYRPAQPSVDFPLAPSPVPAEWRFAHLSDTHAHTGNRDRLHRALAVAEGRKVDFAVVSGDLVRDALRVDEETARGEYQLYAAETKKAAFPVRSAVGNHEVFAIERHLSLVPATHPAYGKAMFEEMLGPRYYAFARGKLHFIVLDSVGVDDLWYYGSLDETQLAWIRAELAHVPHGTTLVTVCHIPLRSGALSLAYVAEGAARTLLNVKGETGFRHVVRNAAAIEEILKPYRWTMALQGHSHIFERLRIRDGDSTRYHTAPAVDFRPQAPLPSGLVIYSVRGDVLDDGELVRLDGK